MSVIKVTKDNFNELISGDKPVLLDFYADWCGPCRMVAPIVEQIAEEHGEFAVGKINVDEQQELAAQFNIMSIPTLAVMKNGEVAQISVGAKGKDAILEMLED